VTALAKNKAIFDTDILINVVKTKSVEYLVSVFEQIYVSDYVWNCEIKEDSQCDNMINDFRKGN